MATATRVEAKSLSALNFLAANPPQYPVNPTEELRESLVLYISRVPGTRDVILSPFKPQVKNVTAADVANSLYYVHLDVPSDGLLAAPPPHRDENSPRSSCESARSPIQRKPLPPTAKIPKSVSEEHPNLTPVPGLLGVSPMPRASSHAEVSLSAFYAPPGDRRSSEPVYDNLPEQPPPPPPHLTLPGQSSPLGRGFQDHQFLPERDQPTTPNRRYQNTSSYAQPTRQSSPFSTVEEPPRFRPPFRTSSRSPSPAKSRSHKPSTTPFSLTLIRREPALGHQWNVGKISSFQDSPTAAEVMDPDAQDAGGPRRQPVIDIHIDNSGYAKFRGMPTRESIDAFRSGSSSSLPLSRSGPRNSMGDDMWGGNFGTMGSFGGLMSERQAADGFTRHVAMTYTKSWAKNLKQALGRRDRHSHSLSTGGGADPFSDADDLGLSPPKPLSMRGSHVRNNSAGSAASIESFMSRGGGGGGGDSPSQPAVITQPGPGLRPKGYAFASPWDGRCDFRTSNGGRSLRCKHILQRGGAGFGGADGEADTRPVSELRFNLPNRDLFKAPREGSPANGDRDGHRHKQSAHLHDQFVKLLQLDAESGDDLDAPMDLSLGREKAGGGNRGKRAKLGKLIIHDEGLKMLDLVVAANVGVWWVAWEKAF